MTGNPTAYSDLDLSDLFSTLVRAFNAYGPPPPEATRMFVTATIEWSGETNPRAHRSTTLTGLTLGPTRAAVQRALDAGAAVRRTSSAPRAADWEDQIRSITRTQAGYRAADQAGLNVTPRTLIGWLSQKQTPSKANQARIAEAYGRLRDEQVSGAQNRAEAAEKAACDALTAAIGGAYGAEVRLRNITDMDLER